MRLFALALALTMVALAPSALAQTETCRPWDVSAEVVNVPGGNETLGFGQRLVLNSNPGVEAVVVTGARFAATRFVPVGVGDDVFFEYRAPMADLRPDLDGAPIAAFDQSDLSLTVNVTSESDDGVFYLVYELTHAPVTLPTNQCLYIVFGNDVPSESTWFPFAAEGTVPSFGGSFGDGVILHLDAPGAQPRVTTFGADFGLCLQVEGASAPTIAECQPCTQPDIPISDIAPNGECFGFVCAGGGGSLTDFSCFLSWWASGNPNADITTDGLCFWGQRDGAVTLSDFSCYLATWATPF